MVEIIHDCAYDLDVVSRLLKKNLMSDTQTLMAVSHLCREVVDLLDVEMRRVESHEVIPGLKLISG